MRRTLDGSLRLWERNSNLQPALRQLSVHPDALPEHVLPKALDVQGTEVWTSSSIHCIGLGAVEGIGLCWSSGSPPRPVAPPIHNDLTVGQGEGAVGSYDYP